MAPFLCPIKVLFTSLQPIWSFTCWLTSRRYSADCHRVLWFCDSRAFTQLHCTNLHEPSLSSTSPQLTVECFAKKLLSFPPTRAHILDRNGKIFISSCLGTFTDFSLHYFLHLIPGGTDHTAAFAQGSLSASEGTKQRSNQDKKDN